MNRIGKTRRNKQRNLAVAIILAFGLVFQMLGVVTAQDRIKSMPGYDQYQKMSKEIPGSVKMGSLIVKWKDDGSGFDYVKDGKNYHYDIATKAATETGAAPEGQGRFGGRGGGRGGRAGGPERGRQFDSADSPDKKLRAFYRDHNLWLANLNVTKNGETESATTSGEFAVTTDGSEKTRVKYATGSWVYGEELRQTTAMWWSPDSTKIAYYRFDESPVPDYYLQMHQVDVQDQLDKEAYPKAGAPNPIVDLFIYDINTKQPIKLDIRNGKPFENSVIGYYAYDIRWSPDGTELLLNRTNRRQNVMELTACSPQSGKCRTVVTEEWPQSWVTNSPEIQFLKDGKRFVWASERTGFRNLYLYDLSGKLISTVTNDNFEVQSIVAIDEPHNQLYYMSHDGDNPMKLQLHRVGLNGKGDVRLTDPAYLHAVQVSPDFKYFVDVAQTHDIAPFTRLMDAEGKVVAELAKSDMSKFEQLGLKKQELIKYKAADGETDLYGLLSFPSNFDPNKKYPLLVTVYAGPDTNGARETFSTPTPLTEYGFLIASLDSRSVAGRGKKITDTIYLKLGIPEMDDQAAGVKSLWTRAYVDKDRVGIFGTSYGGYSSVMCLLRHPEVFKAASASSPVTDWRNYDSIYTERYMWIPEENKAGYDAGSAMTYAKDLKGRLLIYYGTSDNNVHPANTLQLITALQKENKSFDVQVGPDKGHTAVNQDRMMEFFIDNLVLAK
ncbi:MAG TPA: DPP IV N-terminal domain-containing protein [Blastocatellia bacterium]|nr:DPP IV N-terminal domain-containing protein [Blastocatellia bacterium]